jgi:galactose mutarotase-like enzyme
MKNPSTLVSEAKKVAKENNATFRGDATSGSFSGRGVEGRYKIEGGTVKVTITDKPALASWSTVESKVKEFFR